MRFNYKSAFGVEEKAGEILFDLDMAILSKKACVYDVDLVASHESYPGHIQ